MSESSLVHSLQLAPHPEGGYFRRTHENSRTVPCPFPEEGPGSTRLASTSIHYLLTPASPIGHFHRNKALCYHFHHRGRGRYRLIGEQGEVDEFVVGPDVAAGEKLMWAVEGGVWKSSELIVGDGDGDGDGDGGGEGLLISEVVVPGFEFRDHEFLDWERLQALVGPERAGQLRPFLKPGQDCAAGSGGGSA